MHPILNISHAGQSFTTLFLARNFSNFNTATGKVGEILVVTDKGVWDSDLKQCLDTNLTQWIMPYFPDVATFELFHKTPSHFEKGVKSYRNILFLKIDQNFIFLGFRPAKQ